MYPSDGGLYDLGEALLPVHTYTYLTTDLRNNAILSELPLQNISYSNVLSGAGEFGGSIAVNNETLPLDLRTVTAPGKTGLYVLRDGEPVWGGIIWKRNYDSSSRQMKISGKTFESYFYKRLQLTTKAWDDADQLDIARWLVTSNGAAQVLDIEVSNAMSGQLRDRVMFGYEFKTTGTELEQLANLIDGFDWNVKIWRKSDGTLGRRLEFYYPEAGISRNATLHFFDHPGSIKSFTLSEDAENGGTSIWSIGAGEGTEQVNANAVDPGAIAGKYPPIEISRSYKSVVRPSTLQEHSRADLARLAIPVTVFEVDVHPDLDPLLGSYGLGDWAKFRMHDLFLDPPLEQYARITGIEISIDNGTGLENVGLTLGGEEVDSGEV